MPSFDLTGTVKAVMDPITFESGFAKREFVVTTEDDRYPQAIKFECVKDRMALLDGIEPGRRVTVSFDLRGNEYKGRYFVNLTAWKVEPAGESLPDDPAADAPPLDQRTPPESEASEETPF